MNPVKAHKILLSLSRIVLFFFLVTPSSYAFTITMEDGFSVTQISGIEYDGKAYDIDFVAGNFVDIFNVDTSNCIWNDEVIVDYSMGSALSATINDILAGFGLDDNYDSIAKTDGFGYYVMPIAVKGTDPYTDTLAFGAIESHTFYGPWYCYGQESMLPGYLGTSAVPHFSWAHVTLTPVPEPSSMLLSLMGFIGFGGLVIIRKKELFLSYGVAVKRLTFI